MNRYNLQNAGPSPSIPYPPDRSELVTMHVPRVASASTASSTGRVPVDTKTKPSLSRKPRHPDNQRQPTKAVRFANRAMVLLIPALDDMSDQQKEAIWTTDEDRENVNRDIVNTVRSHRAALASSSGDRHGHNQLPPNMAVRGLEVLVNAHGREGLRRRRQDLIDAVLDLQDEYWNRGATVADPEAIGRVCARYTTIDTEEAISLAASDAAYVRQQQRRR